MGEEARVATQSRQRKHLFSPKKMLIGAVLLICTLAVMFGMGVLAAHYVGDTISSGTAVAVFKGAAPEVVQGLARRDDNCTETAVSHISAADAVEATASSIQLSVVVITQSRETAPGSIEGSVASSALESGSVSQIGIPIPISTIYSFKHEVELVTATSTTTTFDYVTIAGGTLSTPTLAPTVEASEDICNGEVITKTVSITVTFPQSAGISSISYPAPDDATVTGNPSTITNIQTDLSLTGGLPDATVSGNPSTVTDFQTDVSLTSGLPDATVSGNPSTVTDVQTDVSITSGLPDATISGNPSTVTDINVSFSLTTTSSTRTSPPPSSSSITSEVYPSGADQSTVVEVVTEKRTSTVTTSKHQVTVIITDLYPSVKSSTLAQSDVDDGVITATTSTAPIVTFTEFVTTTTGTPRISLTTIQVPFPPYPSVNTTSPNYPSGTVANGPVPTTPVVISGAKPMLMPGAWHDINFLANFAGGFALMAAVALLF